MSTTQSERATPFDGAADVIELRPQGSGGMLPAAGAPLGFAAMLVAAVLACSPLASGYFNFTSWAPLALGAVVILVVLGFAARPAFTRLGLTAAAGLACLLALSFASMLWAESRENAWTDSNRLAVYCVIFAIGLLAIRTQRSARAVMLILGAPALLSSVILALIFAGGGGAGAFLQGRLDSPIGYVNGTAGLLVMGLWPLVALAESDARRSVRALGLAGAAAIAATAVTTQSRAIVPALLLATVLVLAAAPQRTRRGINLLLIALSVGASLHWTLGVYSSTGPTQQNAIPADVLRSAGIAILLACALAFVLKLAASTIAARLPEARRELALRRLGQLLLAATLTGALVVIAAGHGTIARQWDDFTQLKAEQTVSNRFLSAGGFRYDLWRIAVDEFRAHPFGGVGAGSYDADYYRLRRNPQSVTQPHSLELQMAAELGIVGLLSLLVFCGAILAAGLTRRRETLAAGDRMIRVAALGMFTAWLGATSVDWLYDIPGLAGMAILAAAMLVVPAPSRERRAGGRGRSRGAQAALAVGLGILALIAAGIGRQYAAARYASSGDSEVVSSPARGIGTLETAESLDPYSLTTLYAIASAYARLDDYQAARDVLLRAERLEPDNYVPPALLGDLAFRRGDFGVALAAYEQAQRLDPREPALANSIVQTKAAL